MKDDQTHGRGPDAMSPDARVFLVASGIGVATLLVLKLAKFPQPLITILMVGVVIGYSIAVVRFPRLHLRLDQAGDNAYYLGLIFTLLSMGWALWDVGLALKIGSEEVRAAESVIGDFGLALATTLAGIVCRIILHQMRLDPGDVEQAARMQLAEASSRMKAQLTDLTSFFGQHLVQLQQTQSDYARELAETHINSQKAVHAELEHAAKSAALVILESGKQVRPAMHELAQTISQLANSLEEAISRLSAIEAPPLKLGQHCEALALKVDVLTSRVSEASSRIEPSTERLATALQVLDEAIVSLSKFPAELQSHSGAAVRLGEQAAEAIRRGGEDLARIGAQSNADVAALQKSSESAVSAATAAQDSAVRVLGSLERVVTHIDQKLRGQAEP